MLRLVVVCSVGGGVGVVWFGLVCASCHVVGCGFVVWCFWLFEFCFSFTRLLGCVTGVIGLQIRFVDWLVEAGVALA